MTGATERSRPGPTRLTAWQRFWRRRRFIVDLRLQGGLLIAFIVQFLVFAALLAVAMFLPPILALADTDGDPVRLLHAARQMLALHELFWPALGAAAILVLLLGIRTSHKIAGPLYRFRRVYGALLRGEDPGPVRLRKGDYLKPEAAELERVVRAVVRDRRRLAELEETLRAYHEGPDDEAARETLRGQTVAARDDEGEGS